MLPPPNATSTQSGRVAMTPPQRNPEERPVARAPRARHPRAARGVAGDIAAETEEMHPADLADVAEALPIASSCQTFLAALPRPRAPPTCSSISTRSCAPRSSRAMTRAQAAALVTQMTPDERADVLEELERGARRGDPLRDPDARRGARRSSSSRTSRTPPAA